MPTISQLPAATAVAGTDQIPISQSGLTRSVSVGTLLGGTQSTIALTQGSLLGRLSNGLGGPESVGVGTGLVFQGASLAADGLDHVSFPLSTSLLSGDEVVVNSGLAPKRLPATALRSIFTAGSGVAIDSNGVISSTVTASSSGTGTVGPAGPVGPQGPMGPGFNFRGSWGSFTSYAPYDVLVYGGQSYVVMGAFTSTSTFDSSHLTLIAAQGSAGVAGQQGAVGSQGATGAQGPAGPTIPATAVAIGAVKPGAGLAVSADGTLTIGNVNLSTLAQTGATTGQLLGWTGTGWGPTAVALGGVSTFNSRTGTVSLSLGDVTGVVGTGASARANLELAAVAGTGAYSDLTGAPAIPSASTVTPIIDGTANVGASSSFARADHVHPTDTSRLAATSNLSDLANVATARINLGLGTVATLSVGTAAGTVAAGNDSRLTAALQTSAIPAASGQLLGGSGVAGAASGVSVGTGLTLSGGTLSANGGSSTYTLPIATTTTLGGVKPDGSTITTAADGTLTVKAVSSVSTFNTRSGAVTLTSSDVTAALGTGAAAKTNLGLATVAATGAFLDLAGAPAIPSASTATPVVDGTANVGASSSFARADHVHPTDTSRLAATNNLSDVANVATARTNLGLGAAATLSVGTTAGTVAAGNDTRITGALQAAAIPAASGQLLGGSGAPGAASGVSVGTGLTLSGGTLSATGGSSNYTLPVATTTTLGGVKPDGSTVTTASDGTLTVAGVSVTALTDIGTLGGPALSDVDIVNRNNNDYRTTLSARTTLFRKTPAGSRTITLASGATTATLTAGDNDKTIVVGGVAGSLTVDGTITDGFRCQVINHTSAALTFSGITGLGATSVASNAVCWVTLSNSTVEATLTGPSTTSSSYTLPPATTSTLGGVKPDGATVTTASDGTLTVSSTNTTSLTDIGTLGGPALTDIDVLNRSGTDYKTALSARSTLFRKTPAGSRTVTLASGTTTATLTATDHDKTVVVNGVAGTLTVDGTITDGFRCTVINHTGASLTFTSIAGLQGTTSLPNNASCVVSLANAIVEALPPGSATAYISAGVSGLVSSLPGGAGAVIYRHVFVRPCTLAVNLATPYAPQGQAGTLPAAAAAFGIVKRQSSGTQTSVGSLTISTTGAVTSSVAALTSFVAGDELIVTAPSPADTTLADVSLTFTGTWG